VRFRLPSLANLPRQNGSRTRLSNSKWNRRWRWWQLISLYSESDWLAGKGNAIGFFKAPRQQEYATIFLVNKNCALNLFTQIKNILSKAFQTLSSSSNWGKNESLCRIKNSRVHTHATFELMLFINYLCHFYIVLKS